MNHDNGRLAGRIMSLARVRGWLNSERILMVAAVFAIYCVFVLRTIHVNIDDQFMLYRYAANIARGAGLTFTAGERVEGFTTFLYTLILAGLFKLFHLQSGDVQRIAYMTMLSKVVGFACGLTTLRYLAMLLRQLLHLPRIAVAASLLGIVSCPDFTFSTTNGLETGLVILLYTAVTTQLISWGFNRQQSRFPVCAMALSCLLVLARADGLLLVAAIIVPWLILECIFVRPRLRTLAMDALALGLPPLVSAASYMSFRRSYFGSSFPQSYYVKFYQSDWASKITLRDFWSVAPYKHITSWERIPITLRGYVVPAVWGYVALFVIYSLYVIWRSRGNEHRFNARTQGGSLQQLHGVLAVVVPTIPLLAYASVIGDWMPGHRMVVQFAIPSMAVLTGCGLWLAYALTAPMGRAIRLTGVACLVLGTSWTSDMYYDEWLYNAVSEFSHPESNLQTFAALRGGNNFDFYMTSYREFWSELAEHLVPGDTVAVYESGYASLALGDNIRIIDLSGLNDQRMSVPDSREYYALGAGRIYHACANTWRDTKASYIMSKRPKFIVFDTFQLLWCESFPIKLYNDQYRLIDFPHNELGFFSVYTPNSANVDFHSSYPNLRCSPRCNPFFAFR